MKLRGPLLILLLFAFVEIPAFGRPAAVRFVLFTPSGVPAPEAARHRLTQIADYAEKFFFHEMDGWGYPAAAQHLFRRDADGLVEVLAVKGDKPADATEYSNSDCVPAIVRAAERQYRVDGGLVIWWIFMFLGDRPARFSGHSGAGNPVDGGWAIVNYDSMPGEIRSDLSMAEGFHQEIFLKATIHELGHAFGLPHVGPDATLRRGNSLMGPTTAACESRKYPDCTHVYLSQSSAAMLWKHPIFKNDGGPQLSLREYHASYDSASDSITVYGKLISDRRAHTVVLIDNRGRPSEEYWFQSYAARISPDGEFRIRIPTPAKADGAFRLLFCLDSGIVTGDGAHFEFENRGAIWKSYTYRDGAFAFSD